MLILGWHGNPRLLESQPETGIAYHDAAAVILHDGALVAAIEDERLNRAKHSTYFPKRAISFCLREARATLGDLDVIITDSNEEFLDQALSRSAARDPRLSFQNSRQVIAASFQHEFGVDVSRKLRFCNHHVAHLCGTWYPSGFSDGLIICFDGSGDGASGLIAHCDGGRPRILRELPEEASLGHFYLRQLFFLGYKHFDEYKVMGLAPYGNAAVYEPLFQKFYQLEAEGRFTLLPEFDRLLLMSKAGLTAEARRKGQPFTQAHKDFAATLQATLERIVRHVVTHFRKTTGARRLCLSGGVAHNCTMNGNLLRSGLFEQIYVQPAAHDAGNALGAAISFAQESGESIRGDLVSHLYLGTHIGSADEIGRRLESWRPLIEIERVADAPQVAAGLLAAGSVIAWVQGRSEFGPRALGNRSILADPRPAENKHIVNAMVKKREDYRPFAPAVPQEHLHDYFEVPASVRALPFMVMVVPVRSEARELLAAVTHVDGTARVQSVSRSDNPGFHAVIKAFGRLTGVPVVLNTSFNNNAEPIVDSVDDSVTTFLTTGIHALVIGDWLVRKPPGLILSDALLNLVPHVPSTQQLTRLVSRDQKLIYGVESLAGRLAVDPVTPISRNVFDVLLHTEVSTPLRDTCHRLGLEEPTGLTCLGTELLELWSARKIRLLPAVAP